MDLPNLATAASKLPHSVLESVVHTVRTLVDALADQAATPPGTLPGGTDYSTADHDASAPAGGWLSVDELRDRSKQMTEAIAAEHFEQGFLMAVQLMAMLGGAA